MNQFAEPDDDEVRMRKTELQLHAITVRRLLALKAEMTRGEQQLLADLDLRICVMGDAPCEAHVRQIKNLAWKYRRRMPRHLALKVPPHDPIVMEMEKSR